MPDVPGEIPPPGTAVGLAPAPTDSPPTSPIERGLVDPWSRTAQGLPVAARRELRAGVQQFAGAFLWELHNLVHDRLPDPIDHLEMRRRSGGTLFSTRLARSVLGSELPRELVESPTMRTLIETFADIGPWWNDIFSYRKEIELEGEAGNSVLIVQRLLGCDLQEAENTVSALLDIRMRRFERTAAEGLPALMSEFGLDAHGRELLERYVQDLRAWMAGDLAWSLQTGRHADRGSTPPGPCRA
jgi:germacradienol/geosmin synthase